MHLDTNSKIHYLSFPDKNIHLFSCDSNYFNIWGEYTLLTSASVGFNTHFHIINPTQENFLFYEETKKEYNNITMSYQNLDINKWHSLKQRSFLFCSRYLIAKEFMETLETESILITDADMIFKKKFSLDNINLGILYKPTRPTLWSRGGGNLFFIRNSMKQFLKDFYDEFFTRFNQTLDYKKLETESKLVRAEKIGLDQVCLAYLIEKNKYNFTNLIDLNLRSKNFYDDTPIWSLTGGGKKNPNLKGMLDDILPTKYKHD